MGIVGEGFVCCLRRDDIRWTINVGAVRQVVKQDANGMEAER